MTVPAGQTLDAFAKALREGEAEPGKSITAATGFTTKGGPGGSRGRVALPSATRAAVSDGTTGLKLYAAGSTAALAALRVEFDRVAASTTIAS